MRVKRGLAAHRRHKRILKRARGMRGGRSKLFRTAREQTLRGLKIAYKERRRKKREYRRLWIVRINAASRALGTKYSQVANWLSNSDINLDRKMLAELAVVDFDAFKAIVDQVRPAA